jgi:hypothetical protein
MNAPAGPFEQVAHSRQIVQSGHHCTTKVE